MRACECAALNEVLKELGLPEGAVQTEHGTKFWQQCNEAALPKRSILQVFLAGRKGRNDVTEEMAWVMSAWMAGPGRGLRIFKHLRPFYLDAVCPHSFFKTLLRKGLCPLCVGLCLCVCVCYVCVMCVLCVWVRICVCVSYVCVCACVEHAKISKMPSKKRKADENEEEGEQAGETHQLAVVPWHRCFTASCVACTVSTATSPCQEWRGQAWKWGWTSSRRYAPVVCPKPCVCVCVCLPHVFVCELYACVAAPV